MTNQHLFNFPSNKQFEEMFVHNCFEVMIKSKTKSLQDFQKMVLELAIKYYNEGNVSLEFIEKIKNEN
jgi:hypothetical protein